MMRALLLLLNRRRQKSHFRAGFIFVRYRCAGSEWTEIEWSESRALALFTLEICTLPYDA